MENKTIENKKNKKGANYNNWPEASPVSAQISSGLSRRVAAKPVPVSLWTAALSLKYRKKKI